MPPPVPTCCTRPDCSPPSRSRPWSTPWRPSRVNVVVGNSSPLTVADLAALGVRRVSIGGALARSAWAGFQRAAQALLEGRFDGFAGAMPSATLNAFFRDDADRR